MSITDNSGITTLGVVSFLNARPLIEGLDANCGISLHYAVPSALPSMLRSGQVDAALIPVVDLARGADAWQRISNACIGSDGETLTVRVFSRVPPEHMNVLYVDEDSHTSIALAQLIWLYWYERRLTFIPLSAASDVNDCESVLLIGDKVVNSPLQGYEHEIDLGGAWKEWTGLPFVFAVWAAPSNIATPFSPAACGGEMVPDAAPLNDETKRHTRDLSAMLATARDRGVARAPAIAAEMGPALGWPIDLAREYLTRRLIFTITPRAEEGLRRFLELAADEGIIPNTPVLAK